MHCTEFLGLDNYLFQRTPQHCRAASSDEASFLPAEITNKHLCIMLTTNLALIQKEHLSSSMLNHKDQQYVSGSEKRGNFTQKAKFGTFQAITTSKQ